MLKDKSPEFFFVLYIFSFSFLKPILNFVGGFSTIVLFAAIGLILVFDLYYNSTFCKSRISRWFVFTFFFIILFAVQLIWVRNDLTINYMINFVLYAVLPLFFMMNVRDFKKVLFWVYRLSVLTGLILIWDPLLGLPFTKGYMEYGFNMAMYSFCGLLVGYYYFANKRLLPFLAVELFAIAVWGNKGALLASGAVLLAAMVGFGNYKWKYIIAVLMGGGVFFWKSIVLFLIEIVERLGFGGNYSINTFKILLSDKRNLVLSARTDIWEEAFSWIKKYPVLGSGVASFESFTKNYAHNIFFDITVTFGILGLICFVGLLVASIRRLCKTRNQELKIFQWGCFIFWFVAMQFSLTFWNVSLFWVYWGLYLYRMDRMGGSNESISSML